MNMKAVIAEKHSVAVAIAEALGGGRAQRDWIGCEGAVVTWAQGHLVELAEPGDYKGRGWERWSMDTLPIDPDRWQWNVDARSRERYRAIRDVVSRDDVDVLVNACDPDREGEAIFDRVVHALGCGKPRLRLWVASLEPDAIRQAWDAMRPDGEYRGLAAAADIRAKADWLIGMNASRAYSLVYDSRLNVGRVATPTLALVVERDRAVESHVPVPFHTAVAPMGGWELTGPREADEATARRQADAAAVGLRVTKAERRTVRDRPPHLYDLTGLQKDMNRLHSLPAARTLAALQNLYERKLATYPRTDSQFVTHDDLPTLETLLASDALRCRFAPAAEGMASRADLVVDDSRVAGHTAILPTRAAADVDQDTLGEDERLTLTRVVRRMYEAVGDDRVRVRTHIEATGGDGCVFTATSHTTIEGGWTRIEPEATRSRDADDKENKEDAAQGAIPDDVKEGDALTPSETPLVRQGHTSPPKRFTESTLLAAMEHASRFLDDQALKDALDDDASHSGGIGTPATRADVIEKLLRYGYVERVKRALVSTKPGRALVHVVDPKLTDIAFTARMEQALSDVEHGDADARDVMARFREYAVSIPALAREHRDGNAAADAMGDGYGPCPRCGKPVVKRGRLWTCSTNRSAKQADGTWKDTAGCGWKLYPKVAGVTLTDANARALLAGRPVKRKGFTSKKGRTFDATLVIDADHGTRFVFNDHGTGKRTR